MIYAARIRQARLIAGLTQTQLAEATDVRQAAVAYFEAGKRMPSLATSFAIAVATGVSVTFLEKPPLPQLPHGSLAYRSRANARETAKELALQYTALLVEQLSQMTSKLRIPALRIRSASGDPLKAARLTRMVLGVQGPGPVPHVLRQIERSGGVVLSLPLTLRGIDAFSLWAPIDTERPVTVLSSDSAGDRRRFTAAHELGHLVMHRSAEGYTTDDLEREADLFAAEFLLPAAALQAALAKQSLTLELAMRLKAEWKVSMQMIVRRARDIGAISERRYRRMFQQLSARGWRTHEPVIVAVELPRLYRQLAEKLYTGDCASQLAEEYGLSSNLATRLLEPYATRSRGRP